MFANSAWEAAAEIEHERRPVEIRDELELDATFPGCSKRRRLDEDEDEDQQYEKLLQLLQASASRRIAQDNAKKRDEVRYVSLASKSSIRPQIGGWDVPPQTEGSYFDRMLAPKERREVYVGNLPFEVKSEMIFKGFCELFQRLPDFVDRYPGSADPVLKVRIPESNAGKFAFVELLDETLAQTAILMSGFELAGRAVKVARPSHYNRHHETLPQPLNVEPLRDLRLIPGGSAFNIHLVPPPPPPPLRPVPGAEKATDDPYMSAEPMDEVQQMNSQSQEAARIKELAKMDAEGHEPDEDLRKEKQSPELVAEEVSVENYKAFQLMLRSLLLKRLQKKILEKKEAFLQVYEIGQRVECRDAEDPDWWQGVVTSVDPLQVRPHNSATSFQFDAVRPLSEAPVEEVVEVHVSRIESFIAEASLPEPVLPSLEDGPCAEMLEEQLAAQIQEISSAKFKCKVCDKTFRGKDLVYKHLHTAHPDLRNVVVDRACERIIEIGYHADSMRPGFASPAVFP